MKHDEHASEILHKPLVPCHFCFQETTFEIDIKGQSMAEAWDLLATASTQGRLSGWHILHYPPPKKGRYAICPKCYAERSNVQAIGIDTRLLPFNVNSQCPKCLSSDVTRTFCVGGADTAGCPAAFPYFSEHLHHECQRCRYRWETRTAHTPQRVDGDPQAGLARDTGDGVEAGNGIRIDADVHRSGSLARFMSRIVPWRVRVN
jgi:hypothetical protein